MAPRELLTAEVSNSALRGVVRDRGLVGDLIPTYWAAVFTVTLRLVDVLRASSLTGWRTLPVTVPGPRLPPIFLLQVCGRCGPIRGASGRSVGLFLDPRTWDGSDLFLPENEDRILMTARCADALSVARLKNVELSLAGLEASDELLCVAAEAAPAAEDSSQVHATALENGIPLITGDADLASAVMKLGGEVRWFAPGA